MRRMRHARPFRGPIAFAILPWFHYSILLYASQDPYISITLRKVQLFSLRFPAFEPSLPYLPI